MNTPPTEKILNWAAVIVVPIVLFALTPYWSSLFADQRKLEYWLVGKKNLRDDTFGLRAKDWPEISATYAGKPIEDAMFLTFALVNTGKIPVRAEDFEGPLDFEFDNPQAVLAYRIAARNPHNLSPQIDRTTKGLSLRPLLLNPTDGMYIEVVASADVKLTQASGRISGIRGVTIRSPERFSGLSIEKIKPKDIDRTIQSSLFRFQPYSAVIVAFACFALVALVLPLNRLAKGLRGKTLLASLVFVVYSVGMIAANIFPSSILADDVPSWAHYTVVGVVVILPLMLGLRARRLFFYASSVNATSPPPLPNEAPLGSPAPKDEREA